MAIQRYNAAEAEARWQKIWEERGIFATKNDDVRKKYYVLEMFPYPSGRIHMGHVRNYTMGDVVARVKRAMGYSVLHPMGWDAFGMPAENAAMERKVHPKIWTYENIAAMKAQLKSMGLSLDWAREIATCDPAYYKQQQKMFLDFLRAGLVERKLGKVNWETFVHRTGGASAAFIREMMRKAAALEERHRSQRIAQAQPQREVHVLRGCEPFVEALQHRVEIGPDQAVEDAAGEIVAERDLEPGRFEEGPRRLDRLGRGFGKPRQLHQR